MKFLSTRGAETVTGAEAIVNGFAEGGGLYVPAHFPQVSKEELDAMLGMDYPERAAYVLQKYFDEYDGAELLEALNNAYAAFEGDDPAPLVKVENGMYVLELYHGPTCAYKDMALTVLPYLLRKGAELCGVKEKLLLFVATSGDAGKAALESFKDQEGVRVMVFYPDEGVSKMQKLQLSTQEGENLNVVAVRGNFDDCRNGVRKIIHSEKCREEISGRGYKMTSGNSVNFGVLALEICYFFSAYLDLVSSEQIALGDAVNFAFPAGDLDNLLAAIYAKKMGLPVGTLVCASNTNNALTDFFRRGTFPSRRTLYPTMSPSMDILVPSNLERLIFETSGRGSELTKERMQSLAQTGKFSVRAEELKLFHEEVYADFTSEDDTVECVYDFFDEYGYAMDTHTGVTMNVAMGYEKKVSDTPGAEKLPMVLISTDSPYKFPQAVYYALTGNDVKDSYKGVKRINLLTAMKVPEPIKAIRYLPIRFKNTVTRDKMKDEVLAFLDA